MNETEGERTTKVPGALRQVMTPLPALPADTTETFAWRLHSSGQGASNGRSARSRTRAPGTFLAAGRARGDNLPHERHPCGPPESSPGALGNPGACRRRGPGALRVDSRPRGARNRGAGV